LFIGKLKIHGTPPGKMNGNCKNSLLQTGGMSIDHPRRPRLNVKKMQPTGQKRVHGKVDGAQPA
jgi:hypothetical protein